VALAGVDIFDPVQPQSSGPMPLALDTPIDQLQCRVRFLIKRESHLFNEGVVCGIKDINETACSACPLNRAADGSAKGLLCQIGVEQEQVLTLIAAQRERRQGAEAL
jgi:hypothetical protein